MDDVIVVWRCLFVVCCMMFVGVCVLIGVHCCLYVVCCVPIAARSLFAAVDCRLLFVVWWCLMCIADCYVFFDV